MRMMRNDSSNLAGSNCIKDKNGKFSEDGRMRVWNEHMKAIMNEGNPWNRMVDVEEIEDPVKSFAEDEMEKGLGIIKNGKASGPTKIVKKHLAAYPHGRKLYCK